MEKSFWANIIKNKMNIILYILINNIARILKQHNTKNIVILVKGVFNPFFKR
jgi:DNA-binding LacI/PurR family transcriptional regulator